MLTISDLTPGDVLTFDGTSMGVEMCTLFGKTDEEVRRFSFFAVEHAKLVLIPIGLSVSAKIHVPIEVLARARKIPKTSSLN